MKFIDKHFNKIMTVMVFLLGVTIAWAWIQKMDKDQAAERLETVRKVLSPAGESATPLDR